MKEGIPMVWTMATFIGFTILVAVISYVKTKGDDQSTADGYFLAGRGLPGFVIAGFAAADQPVGRAAGRHERPDMECGYEPDGVRDRSSSVLYRAGAVCGAALSEKRHYHHSGADRSAL